MKDAQPGDIYADDDGKLWRVVGIFTEPSVIAEAVEDKDRRIHGGVNASMWNGFERILRHCDHQWHGGRDPRGGVSGMCIKCGKERHVL